MVNKKDKNSLPKDVEDTLEQSKRSRETLQRKLDENAFAESLKKAIRGEED